MKVKELLKTVNVAWSPPAQHPILLAAGTAAQQLDASFNTSASLDLYELNLQQSGHDMELKCSIPSDHRFHKIIWGSYGNNPAGIIVGGCDYGTIKIYSAAKMLANESNCLISSPDRHTGPVRAMDFNPFQANLLATGATESEIYIWDVINTNTPMTPGSRSQPPEDVQHIAWNKQVQHILASTFSQRCVIWDLRKNEPIIKLTDANSKVRWKVVQWHPDVATQLCLASEDDQAPVIELWDLRLATTPLKALQSHQRGVLSIAWNPHDPDLLLSCAKDNRILCWNPNSDMPDGEVICELAQTNQWNFDVSWCPRHPGLIVATSFDGHAAVYSLLGGQQQASSETSGKIVDSFPGMDPFTQPPPVVQSDPVPVLAKAPKWLKRPFGASFGFGGKLTMFQIDPVEFNVPKRKVFVSQVITQPDLIQRSNELEATLKSEQYSDYCKGKADNASDDHSKTIWSCVGAYFSGNVSKSILELLGYNIDDMNKNLNQHVPQQDVNAITEGVANLDNVMNGNIVDGSAAFDAIAQEQSKRSCVSVKAANNLNINTSDDEDGLITQAILIGNIEAAVSLCFESKRYTDAIILSMAGGPDILARTQYRYFAEHTGPLNTLINSIVSENWAEVVKSSDISCWKEVLVGVFTHSNSQELSVLCDMLGDRLESSDDATLKRQAQICYICSGNLNQLISTSNADIQEIVELVTIMQKALERQGVRNVQMEGKIADVVSRYAEMLAAEGSLETALNYLGNGQEQRIVMLRERLCRALGYIQDSQGTVQKAPTVQNLHNQVRKAVQNFPEGYNPLRSTPSAHKWNAAPTKQSYGPPLNQLNAQQVQSHGGISASPAVQSQPQSSYEQYPAMSPYGLAPGIQPAPPPPPTSSASLSGSRPSSVGPQARSKYIIDPSVKSTSPFSHGQSTFPQSTQAFSNSPVPTAPGFPVHNSYQPQVPMPVNVYNSPSQSFMSNLKEQDPFKSMQPSALSPARSAPLNQTYDPITTSQPPSQAQAYSAIGENTYQPVPQPSGWNDPPSGKSARMQPKVEYQPQSPILHPLLGGVPQAEPGGAPQDNFYREPQVPYGQQQYTQHYPSSGVQYNQSREVLHQPQQQPVTPARPAEPEKPKPPIPEQHLHLKTVLDELKDQCYGSAKNPQVKRKLEDVSRKLDVLYDCLRENKLSQNTLQALHQMSRLIQTGDYTGGLSLHTQLVSGPDFSQIASFMPGVKVLLQCALQLGVYIR